MKTEGEVRQASADAVPGWLGDGPFAEPDEEELERERLEIELMAYAHRAAMTWGAERFAEEFHRREVEEARLLAAESRASGLWDDTGPYAGLNAASASASAPASASSGERRGSPRDRHPASGRCPTTGGRFTRRLGSERLP